MYANKPLNISMIPRSDSREYCDEMVQRPTVLSRYLAKFMFTASFIIFLKSLGSFKRNFNRKVEVVGR